MEGQGFARIDNLQIADRAKGGSPNTPEIGERRIPRK